MRATEGSPAAPSVPWAKQHLWRVGPSPPPTFVSQAGPRSAPGDWVQDSPGGAWQELLALH